MTTAIRLLLSTVTALMLTVVLAGPASSGHDNGEQFYPQARLDTTQVQTAKEREAECELWYFERLDLLACL